MRLYCSLLLTAIASAAFLSGCGGGVSVGIDAGAADPSQAALASYVGTTGEFVAYEDPTTGSFAVAPVGSFAGKRQVLRGTVDFTTGIDLSQPAGVEVYKGDDGHIYELDLAATDGPQPQQLSSETNATVDDACSLSGTQVAGAPYAYEGVYFAADLANPTNSSYFYRLPGAGGVCNSGSDLIRMVKTGMLSTDAPITVSAMPVATVRNQLGGISGFIVTSGAQLMMVDSNFQNGVVLGTMATPISVAQALPNGMLSGSPTGQLFVIDGNVVYVDYVGASVSAPLLSLPNWTVGNPGALFAASPTMLYIAQNTGATVGSPATTSIHGIPSDGSAAATLLDTETGRVETLNFPVNGNSLLWGVSNGTYSIRSMADGGGSPSVVATSTVNDGTFVATASAVYYTTWANGRNSSTAVATRSATSTGIVALDGTVIQPLLANSTFVSGGELAPWPDDNTANATPYVTILQVKGLSTVTLTNSGNGTTYVYDAVSGGTLVAIDAATNQQIATIGVLPKDNAVSLSGTFRDADHNGFLEATSPLSTLDPATRNLYVLNTYQPGSLAVVSENL